ncbi:MAG: Ig-like domain-containing protein [Gemmatimonadales bacterium]
MPIMEPRSTPVFSLYGALLALGLLLSGCGGGPEPSVPTTITLDPATLDFSAVGETRQLSPTVLDQRGDPLEGTPVTWTSSDPAVSTVDAAGLVTAQGAGMAQVTVSAGGASGAATVVVTQTATALSKISGDGQTGDPGETRPDPLTVQVNDALGNPVRQATVSFTVTDGGGTVGAPTAITGPDGRASTTLTFGAPGSQQVTATVVGTSLAVIFTATATPPFDIQLRFLRAPSPAQAQAFAAAERRWESLIVADLPNTRLEAAAGQCGSESPAINQTVDDLVILVTLESIDGEGSVLGSAGPCFIRDDVDGLTALGLIRLDTDDLAVVEESGLLSAVILHEMAHVLGFGTLWDRQGLLTDPSATGGTDPHFNGADAIAAFNAAGGTAYVGGQKVPVESGGGEGTADSHWRESVFGNELMTGFVDPGVNPLSRVTISALGDQGYTVNSSAAESFMLSLGLGALRAQGPALHLRDDVLRIPIKVVNQAGQVTRELQR